MGTYMKNQYGMRIHNTQKILTLIIETPPHIPAVCFEVHEQNGGEYLLYWNYEIVMQQMLHYMKSFKERHNCMDIKMAELRKNEAFLDELALINAPESVALAAEEKMLVDAICANRFPEPHYNTGDEEGHAFDLIFADNPEEAYHCREKVPESWYRLAELVNLFVGKVDRLHGKEGDYQAEVEQKIHFIG